MHLASPIVAFRFRVCLSVGACICHSLGRLGNESLVTAGMYGWFELAGLFSSSLQRKSNDASTIGSRGTALVTQVQYHE